MNEYIINRIINHPVCAKHGWDPVAIAALVPALRTMDVEQVGDKLVMKRCGKSIVPATGGRK